MALFRKFFYRKPPDGLLEISERVYGAFVIVFFYSFLFSVFKVQLIVLAYFSFYHLNWEY
jgi:hypothetical protein